MDEETDSEWLSSLLQKPTLTSWSRKEFIKSHNIIFGLETWRLHIRNSPQFIAQNCSTCNPVPTLLDTKAQVTKPMSDLDAELELMLLPFQRSPPSCLLRATGTCFLSFQVWLAEPRSHGCILASREAEKVSSCLLPRRAMDWRKGILLVQRVYM